MSAKERAANLARRPEGDYLDLSPRLHALGKSRRGHQRQAVVGKGTTIAERAADFMLACIVTPKTRQSIERNSHGDEPLIIEGSRFGHSELEARAEHEVGVLGHLETANDKLRS